MRRPTALGLALAWVAVVAMVSTLTWVVIDSAGQEVLVADQLPGLTAQGTTSGAAVEPRPRVSRSTAPSPRPTRSARPGTAPPAAAPPPSATAAATSAPAPVVPAPVVPQATSSQAPAPPPAASAPPPAAPAPPAPAARVDTWQGRAGTVVARCVGSRISLVSATPNDGWSAERGDVGPEQLELEFRSRGEGEAKTAVTARCSGGAPAFRTESEGGDRESHD